MPIIHRNIPLKEILKKKSVLLLGPRRCGKSYLIRNQIKPDKTIDLLKADQFQAYSFRPSLLREQLTNKDKLVAIDEIQKLPSLMDEVHSMIEETNCKFLLTGSSARRLKRGHTALLAGRTRRMHLHPFCFAEISDSFDLHTYLTRGGLPPIYLAESESEAMAELNDYAGDYLKEEILAEALVRKIESFSRFLPMAARMSGELLNFEGVASDSQVPARTIREYFSVLEDTLIGSMLLPIKLAEKHSRKVISKGKFYFFDCGVLNSLLQRKTVTPESPEFGNLFESWIYQELRAYLSYREGRSMEELNFWRSPTGSEVDFVVNSEIGIEAKSSKIISAKHCKGLNELAKLKKLRRKIIVSRESQPKKINEIEILPWRQFMEELWAGEVI